MLSIAQDIIESEIVLYIYIGKEGFPICEIINWILYKLMTGIQWNLLPVL